MTDILQDVSLVVGARGSLGSSVASVLSDRGDRLIGSTSERSATQFGYVFLSPHEPDLRLQVEKLPQVSTVVFCNGMNINDTIGSLNMNEFDHVLEANLRYTICVLNQLISQQKILNGGRIVVLSSIWQEISRPNKFTYSVSKAALGGLVRAAAADLAKHQILINAVLPGPIDNRMTQSVLTPQEIAALEKATSFGRLATNDDVASIIDFLTSSRNCSITGQSITIDLGLSTVRWI